MMNKTIEERLDFLEATAIANLRDFFATSALSILSNSSYTGKTTPEIARYCYQIADAMLIERES